LTQDISAFQYPIGRFKYDGDNSRAAADRSISDIAAHPELLRLAVVNLDETQLDVPYRDGGWTSRQVVHHVADSHMNAYIRFKLALSEDGPTVKPYDESIWATMPDVRAVPIAVSLDLLASLHKRWVAILSAMSDAEFDRHYIHPDSGRPVSLREAAALYAWHGRHHTAHITALRERNGWS
jgi:hypothetical protein